MFDLSENSEYETLQQKMNKLCWGSNLNPGNKGRYAEIVDSDAVAVDEVAIGKTVTVQRLAKKQMKKYTVSSVQQRGRCLRRKDL